MTVVAQEPALQQQQQQQQQQVQQPQPVVGQQPVTQVPQSSTTSANHVAGNVAGNFAGHKLAPILAGKNLGFLLFLIARYF
jgi:hypothetical protein